MIWGFVNITFLGIFMKSKKALLNVIINTFVQVIHVILAFFVRKIFLRTLGADVLGLNSVFSSVLAFLSLTELGLGISVSMCLYKPLAENDTKKISAYMRFLGRMYFLIAIFIFLCGICIIPFLPLIVKGDYSYRFIVISFLLYLISTAVTYFFSHKKILLGADQKSYIVSAGQLIYKIVLNLAHMVILLKTQNYYLFLVISIICNIIENWIIAFICNRQYPYLKNNISVLGREEKIDLLKKMKGMLCYKLGNYLIEGTDNIIISTFLGTITVAYYSNYYLVINMLYAIFGCVGTSAIAGLGNILYSNREELKNAFSRLLLVQHLVYSFSATALYILITDFVSSFFGKESVMPFEVVLLMVGVYYIKGYSQGIEALRNCAGLYEKDKYINIAVACLNVIISGVLVGIIGVSGVLIGTLICYVIKELIVVPWYVMSEMLPGGGYWYTNCFIKHMGITVLIMFLCHIIHRNLFVMNEYITWLLNGVFCFGISLVINFMIFQETREMKEILEMFFSVFRKRMDNC